MSHQKNTIRLLLALMSMFSAFLLSAPQTLAQNPPPPPDADGDGYPDDIDPEPDNPDVPDADGDGVLNADDPEPNNPDVPGDTTGNEPPDADGDGYPDGDDPEPNNPDVPDADGDGVLNADDPEPNNPDVPGDTTDPNAPDPDPNDPGTAQPDFPYDDLPQAIRDHLDAGNLSSDARNGHITKMDNGASTQGGQILYDIELPDESVLLFDESGVHLITLPAIENDEHLDLADTPQPVQDWVSQHAQGHTYSIYKLNGEKDGNATHLIEVEIDDKRLVTFNAQGDFLNASVDPFDDFGNDDNPGGGNDDQITFDQLPQAVRDWINSSEHASSIADFLIWKLAHDGAAGSQGGDLFEIELPDGKELLLDNLGNQILTFPAGEINDVMVAWEDTPQSIKDWISVNAPADSGVEVYKAEGIADGSGNIPFVYEVETVENRVGIFDSTGQLLNTHIDNYDDDWDNYDSPGEDITFDDLPSPVRNWLDGSAHAGDLANSGFREVPNDASPGGGTIIYEVDLPDGRTLILNPQGERLHTVPAGDDSDGTIISDDSTLPQPVQDWITQHGDNMTPEIREHMDAEAGSTAVVYELRFDDKRSAFFNETGEFLHAHTRVENTSDDPNDPGDPNNDQGLMLSELPAPVRNFLENSPFANDLDNSGFWSISNDASTDGGSELIEVELPDGRELMVDAAGNHLITLPANFEDDQRPMESTIPQAIQDWIDNHAQANTSELFKLEGMKDGSPVFLYELEIDDGRFVTFSPEGQLINATMDFDDQGPNDPNDPNDPGNEPHDPNEIAFDDLPQLVKDWLNQSSYAGDLANSEFSHTPNDGVTDGTGTDVYEVELPDGRAVILNPEGQLLHTAPKDDDGEELPLTEMPAELQTWIDQNAPGMQVELWKHADAVDANAFVLELEFEDRRKAFFNQNGQFLHAHYDWDPGEWRPVELPEAAKQYLEDNYAEAGEELHYHVEEHTMSDGSIQFIVFLDDLEITFDADGVFQEERDPWKEKTENITPGLTFLPAASMWKGTASEGGFSIDTTSGLINTTNGSSPAYGMLKFEKREAPSHDDGNDDPNDTGTGTDDSTGADQWDPHTGSMAYTFGFAALQDTTNATTADYDLSATDLTAGTSLTLAFSYDFGPIRYIGINGATIEEFRHRMPDWERPGKISITVEIADPAASASDPDGSILSSAFGLHIEMGGDFHYDGSIMVTDMFWKDIEKPQFTMPWDPVVAMNANGEPGQPVNFAAYTPRWVVEDRFWMKPSEVKAAVKKEDGSLSYITGSTTEGDNFVGSGFQRGSFKGRPFGFDDDGNPVDEPSGGTGNLPDSNFDFDGDGRADNTFMVSFTNDSWSSADIQIGDPFVDPHANQDNTTFGTITGALTDTDGNALKHFDVWVLDGNKSERDIYEGEPVYYEFEPDDTTGTYTIKLPPGVYYLQAAAHDPETGTEYRPEFHRNQDGLVKIEIVDETTQIAGVDFGLKAEYRDTGERGQIKGSVKDDATGEPVYQATIEVYPLDENDEEATDHPIAHGWIDEAGNYHVDAPVGRVKLKIFTYDNSFEPVEEIVDVQPNTETQASDQRLAGKELGTVSGMVTDAAGNPVFANILFISADDEDFHFWPQEFTWEGEDTNAPTGNFTAKIPDGDYKVLAEFWDGTLEPAFFNDQNDGEEDFEDATTITVSSTSPVTGVNLKLQPVPMATVTFKVLKDDGQDTPVDFAFAIFTDGEDEFGEAHYPIVEHSEPFDGTYTAKVPDGEYKVQIVAGHLTGAFFQYDAEDNASWADTHWEEGSVIELEVDETYDLGTVLLTESAEVPGTVPDWKPDANEAATISGWVKTPDGTPVPQAQIIAHTDDYLIWVDHHFTNPDGSFQLEDLLDGTWIIEAVPPFESEAYRGYRESDPLEIELDEGQTVADASLTLKSSNVAGRILFPMRQTDGTSKLKPLEHTFVWAYLDEDNDGWPDYPDDTANPDNSTATEVVEAFGETDAKGFFSFQFAEPGNYKLQVDLSHEFATSKPEPIAFTIQNPNELTNVGNAIQVSWRTKTSADGFNIDRREGKDGTFSTITDAALSAQARSYIDTTIESGVTYSYRVMAGLATGSVALPDTEVEASKPFIYLAPPNKVIDGSVLDTDGNAVTGALVVAFSDHGYAESLTRDDGSFEMNAGAGKWEVTVERPWDTQVDWRYDGRPKKVRFLDDSAAQTKTVNFEVQRATGGKITGTIKKPDGSTDWTAQAGMLFVDAFNEEGDGSFGEVGTDGTFSIDLLPGSYEVSIWIDTDAGDFTAPEPGHVRVKDQAVDLGDIMLGAIDSFINGTLTASDGTPLPNFFVSAWNRHGDFVWDITDANGGYQLAVSPGRWQVAYDVPLPETDDQVIPYLPSEPKKVKVVQSATRTVDFTVPKANSPVTGSVVDAAGNPVADLDVWVYVRNGAQDAGRHDFITDAEVDGRGKFNLILPDGEYIVGLWLPGNSGFRPQGEIAFSISGDTVTFADGATALTLTLLSNDAVISGTFLIGGNPVTGVEGDVVAFRGEEGWVETPIEEDGTYSLSVGPGAWQVDYHIYYDADENRTIRPNPAKPTKVVAISGQTVTQDFTVATAGATITGTVNDETGTQLSDQSVYVFAYREGTDNDEEYWTEVESTDGTFSLSVIAGGTYEVGAFLSPDLREAGYLPPAIASVDLSGGNTGSATLQLAKPSEANFIAGSVLVDGNPVEGAYVFGWSESGQSADAVTDAQGNFKLLVPKGSKWKVGADYVEVDESGNETLYVLDTEVDVDFSTGAETVQMDPITLAAPDFTLPEGIAETFDPTKDFTTVLPDGTEITIFANSVPVDETVTEVRLVISPTASGLTKSAEEQPLDYGYEIELYDDKGKVINQDFLKPVQLTMEFDAQALIDEGIDPEDLEISFFNPTKNVWENAESVVVDVDAGKISATASHFSSWAPTTPPPTSTDVPQEVALLDGTLAGSTDLGSGWYSSPWLGLFYHDTSVSENHWVYQDQLGWMWLYGTDSTNVWIYSDNTSLGWIWTNSTQLTATNNLATGYLYRNSDSRWLYFPNEDDELKFYEYKTGSETEDPGWKTY